MTEGPYTRKQSATFPDRENIVGPTEVNGAFSPAIAIDKCSELNAAYAAGQAAQWIPVSERLPEERTMQDEYGYQRPDGRSNEVLMGYLPPNGKQFYILDLGFYSHKEQAWISKKGMLCTHWMHLPEPPTNP